MTPRAANQRTSRRTSAPLGPALLPGARLSSPRETRGNIAIVSGGYPAYIPLRKLPPLFPTP